MGVRPTVCADLKTVYNAETTEVAQDALEAFDKWPTISRPSEEIGTDELADGVYARGTCLVVVGEDWREMREILCDMQSDLDSCLLERGSQGEDIVARDLDRPDDEDSDDDAFGKVHPSKIR